MDISLDELIARDRKEKPKGGGGGGGRGVAAARGGAPRRATADDLREMDSFGAVRRRRPEVRGGNDKGEGKAGRSWSRPARYEPYGGGGAGGGRWAGGPSWFEDDRDRWDEASGGSRRIVIRNLDYGIMAQDLEELLADFGVQKAWIDYDSTDRSLGTGGALFASPAAATAACRRFHGSLVDGQMVYMQPDSGDLKGKGKGKGQGKSKGKGKGKDW